MPIYKITTKGEDRKRLVKADSAAQAIRHCASDMFTAETVSKVEDAAPLFEDGVKLETAGVEPVEDPEKQQGSETPPNDDPPEEVRKNRANAKLQEEKE